MREVRKELGLTEVKPSFLGGGFVIVMFLHMAGIELTGERVIPDYYTDKSMLAKFLVVKALMAD